MEREAFYPKLCELDEDTHIMQACLRTCQTLDSNELQAATQKLHETSDEWAAHLEDNIRRSRSPALSALAETQKNYYQAVKRITEQKRPAYFYGEVSTPVQEQSEARMLYAEYAIDFARQSIYHALFSALSAISLELLGQDVHRRQSAKAKALHQLSEEL